VNLTTLEQLRTETLEVIGENDTLVYINEEQHARIDFLEGRIVVLLQKIENLNNTIIQLLIQARQEGE
jgi:hypothetical protein